MGIQPLKSPRNHSCPIAEIYQAQCPYGQALLHPGIPTFPWHTSQPDRLFTFIRTHHPDEEPPAAEVGHRETRERLRLGKRLERRAARR